MHWDIQSVDYTGDDILGFLTLLLTLLSTWVLFLLICHYTRVWNLKGGLNRLYREICTIHSREEFLGLAERKSGPKRLKYYSIDFIVASLAEVFQIKNQKNNPYLYRLEMDNLKKEVRDIFLENNRKILLAGIIPASGAFMGFVYVNYFIWYGRFLLLVPLVIAAAISFFSFLLYVSKIKYYYWLLNEIDTLESIYKRFLDPGIRKGGRPINPKI